MEDVVDRQPLLVAEGVTVLPRTRASIGRRIRDFLLVSVVITPSVVLFWRGTWNVLENYLPGDQSVRLWLSLAIGTPVVLLTGLLQRHLARLGQRIMERDYFLYRLFLGVYVYVVAVATIAQWVAFWDLPEHYLPEWDNALGNGVRAVVAFVVMVLLRTVVQGRACPASAFFDFEPEPFLIPLRFRTEIADGFSYKFVADVVFSLFFLDLVTVQNWAGTWDCLNHAMFPDDPCFSYWLSVAIGYALHLLLTFIQFPVYLASKSLRGQRWEFYKRLAIEDSYGLVVNFSVTNVWRGLWGLYDCYILHDQPWSSAWLTHGLGAALCFAVCAGSSLGRIDGVNIDGEAEDGTGVLLQTDVREHGMMCCQQDKDEMDSETNNVTSSPNGTTTFIHLSV